MTGVCLLGDECGLCFTWRDPQPLTAGMWRRTLGQPRPSERTGGPVVRYYPAVTPGWPSCRYWSRARKDEPGE